MSGDFNNKILRPTGMLVHLESAPFLWCGFGFDNHILPGQGALFFGSITSSQDRHEYSGLVAGIHQAVGAEIVALGFVLALWPLRRLQRAFEVPALYVYLSSTVADLAGHRDAAARALRSAGCVVANTIGDAQVFVGFYAWQYGPIAPNTQHSLTEADLDAASHLQQKWLFVLDASEDWPADLFDHDALIAGSPMNRFRGRVASTARPLPRRPQQFADELHRAVISHHRRRHPVAQWRADLLDFRTFVLSGLIAILGAIYSDFRLHDGSTETDHLLLVLAIATGAAAVTYAIRITATRLLWSH